MDEDYEMGLIENLSHSKAMVLVISTGTDVVIDVPENLLPKLENNMLVALTDELDKFIVY